MAPDNKTIASICGVAHEQLMDSFKSYVLLAVSNEGIPIARCSITSEGDRKMINVMIDEICKSGGLPAHVIQNIPALASPELWN